MLKNAGLVSIDIWYCINRVLLVMTFVATSMDITGTSHDITSHHITSYDIKSH